MSDQPDQAAAEFFDLIVVILADRSQIIQSISIAEIRKIGARLFVIDHRRAIATAENGAS
jgi:hypothetical protein